MPDDNNLLSAIPTNALVAELKKRSKCITVSNESIKKCHIGSLVKVKNIKGYDHAGEIGVIDDTNISWVGVRFKTKRKIVWYPKKNLNLLCGRCCCPAQILVVREDESKTL